MPVYTRECICLSRSGYCVCLYFSLTMDDSYNGGGACRCRNYSYESLRGGNYVKILVIESPRFLKGLLRLVFKLEKSQTV